jgi:hypothetical protein
MEYKYRLQKYDSEQKKMLCPRCGKRTFVPYVDIETGKVLDYRVERCGREVNCGYHLSPHEFFSHNGIDSEVVSYSCKMQAEKPKPFPSFIDNEIVSKSLACFDKNNFVCFLRSVFGVEAANFAIQGYRIGTSTHWLGATVFWQTDIHQRVRTGKIMLYDMVTGKRVKDASGSRITWVHSVISSEDFHLRQCLFGEHLLDLPGSSNQICLVESEKTAIICSIKMPQFTWLATGGIQNLRKDTCAILTHRNVLIFPDLGAEDIWNKKKEAIPALHTAMITPILRNWASEEDVRQGLDVEDFILRDID